VEPRTLNVRAVLFDIYGTLLEAGPPPPDAASRWIALCRRALGGPLGPDLQQFGDACKAAIAREHAAAQTVGIAFPEVYWPAIACEALPELSRLTVAARDDFLLAHAGLTHTVRLMPDAAATLKSLAAAGLTLGIASNCQPYTLRELDLALTAAGLAPDIFAPDLCFFSFAHGFSKPDPHVFRLLTARLRARGIAPAATLMIGDRLDNDIEPARAQGWQTWRPSPGGWPALRDRLLRQRP